MTTYRTHGGSKKKETSVCASLMHGPISPGGSDVWNGDKLVIPPLPPSQLPGCNIIIIDYFVQVCVKVTMPRKYNQTVSDFESAYCYTVKITTIPTYNMT